jgi:antitoxin component of MazEF toxin-antitoxin module
VDTKAKTRSVIKSGGSLIIQLPTDFCRKAGIKKGDKIGLVYDSILIIAIPRQCSEHKERDQECKRNHT